MALVATSLRVMRPGDVAAVAALEERIFLEPWSAATLAAEAAGSDRRYLVAEAGGAVAGYGGLMVVGDEAHVMNLAVAPEHRGRGLGTRLLLGLVEAALDAGVRHLTLEVRVSNEAARSLYRRFGFEPAGVRPGYYRGEDALVMWAMDVDGAGARDRFARIREETG